MSRKLLAWDPSSLESLKTSYLTYILGPKNIYSFHMGERTYPCNFVALRVYSVGLDIVLRNDCTLSLNFFSFK